MAQPISHVAIVTGLLACAGCSHTPAAPEPGGPTANSPLVYATPPIRGLIRETNGGPIAGVTVRFSKQVAPNLWVPLPSGPTVVSDGAGGFVLPSSTDVCRAGTVALGGSHRDFRFQEAAVACTPVSNPPEVSIVVKAQRYVTAASGVPVEITLSNEDLDWLTDKNGYSCGPCRIVEVTIPARNPVTVHAERSGPVPIYLWVEGDRGYGDLVRLREVAFSLGDTAIDVNILPEWRDLDYVALKVGLPYGVRFPAGSSPLPVRIEVR